MPSMIKSLFSSRFLFITLLAVILAVAVLLDCLPAGHRWIIHAALALALICLALLWRSVLKPAQAVVRGMELIKAQDFNNRLREVHEVESDKIVALFNQMIDKLRNERLHNREQDGFLKLLIEASPMGVVMLDFNGRVEMMNNSFLRITGIRSAGEWTGSLIDELPSGLARKMCMVELGENKIIRHGDVSLYRCYHLSFIRLGFVNHFYLLESLTEEVMKAERAAYEKVIRIISHEVNNTMGGVRSVLDTLHDICEDDDLKEVIESCDIRCNEMCNFISSYADVVRIPEPMPVDTDLNDEIRKLAPFLQEMVGDGIALRFSPSGCALPVKIDVSLMQQVIVNIVKNAMESISSQGVIQISTRRENSGASHGCDKTELIISNNGAPIPESVSCNLFRPFYSTKKEGRGLGLTLISEILNRHNASFSLMTESDSITRFRIIL